MTCPSCHGPCKESQHGLWRCSKCGKYWESLHEEGAGDGCCGRDFDDRDFEFDYGKPFPEENC